MGWGMHRGSKPATRSVGVAVDMHPRPLDRNVLKVVMRVQWYVIQVMKGREDSMASLIGRVVPKSLLQEVFSPKYETEIKVRGRWVPVQKTLLPGYLIAVTSDPEGLEAMLRDLPEFARLLAQGNEFVPLAPAEVEVIGGFTKPGDRVVPMSVGVKDGDRVVITQGPLVGHEAMVKEIWRRKSIAILEIDMCGRTVTTRVGLGVLSKEKWLMRDLRIEHETAPERGVA